jgi:signal recognition particle GTPase
MELTDKEKDIKNKALQYIKDNETELIEKFADKDDHSPKEDPVSFFMAGSFGAGKTEFSRRLEKQFPDVVLIDADEIRKLCPNYSGEKAYLFNAAAFVGQDILHNYVLDND